MLRPDHGLHFRTWPGAWDKFEDAAAQKPGAEGRVVGLDLWADGTKGDAAVEFEGTWEVGQEGTYKFYLYDKGTSLRIGDEQVARMDRVSFNPAMGKVALGAGRHKIRITALRKGEHPHLRVAVEGPGLPFQSIPLDTLFLPGE